MFFRWLRERREAAQQAEADADALMFSEGRQAYWEARRRERFNLLYVGGGSGSRTSGHWRRVALIIAKRAGRPIGLDVATRMAGRPDGNGGR